ncbi:hypothetical protein [Chromobacterium violaceum]|uniref:Uncharacterized protein n=1 Tax=Chromobacterium violaceum (strain ATCC 12472 / DSM 30191 / JCM 1249 / CCUG 213 / NBRC 12614 / NCIMB 9131 / NCTC 9757 / MK) TaxID=243365 RepID=Q7P0C9_CHRVO|nr:hypothetical protein [Chromobacterium violaceum]AAQ58314.1 hypothetical protein CV_0638 [Chromobacterium violaceum ATCC 12472]
MSSDAKKLFDKLCEAYPDALQDITQLSKNTDANRFFIECSETAFNFDLVYNISPSHRIEKKEKTPDALFVKGDIIYLIEFKEGKFDRDELRQKVHEGVNTLFQFCRKHNLLSIIDFVNIDFRYAVLYRGRENRQFAEALNAAVTIADLKNIEGFLVKNTAVSCTKEGIVKILKSASDGRISRIGMYSKDQTSIEYASC